MSKGHIDSTAAFLFVGVCCRSAFGQFAIAAAAITAMCLMLERRLLCMVWNSRNYPHTSAQHNEQQNLIAIVELAKNHLELGQYLHKYILLIFVRILFVRSFGGRLEGSLHIIYTRSNGHVMSINKMS